MHRIAVLVVAAAIAFGSAPNLLGNHLPQAQPFAAAVSATGSWPWPVAGPVVRAFDPPASPYGTGHRGIDIGAPFGSVVRAPAPGVVYFAGRIGANVFLGVDHGAGLRTTYSWLSGLLVVKGETVVAGQAIAYTGWGHPGDPAPSLHFGVKLGGAYVDPLAYLLPIQVSDLIRLAPL